jgi:hypothetical protein
MNIKKIALFCFIMQLHAGEQLDLIDENAKKVIIKKRDYIDTLPSFVSENSQQYQAKTQWESSSKENKKGPKCCDLVAMVGLLGCMRCIEYPGLLVLLGLA